MRRNEVLLGIAAIGLLALFLALRPVNEEARHSMGMEDDAPETLLRPTGRDDMDMVESAVLPQSPTAMESGAEAFPPRQWPDHIESEIYQYLAQRPELGITSIPKLECDEHICEFHVTGYQIERDAFPAILEGVPWYWGVERVRTRMKELSPGFEVAVIELCNQAEPCWE
jgi:hypothetical protein